MQDTHPDGEYPVYYIAIQGPLHALPQRGVGHLATQQSNEVLLANKHMQTLLSKTQDAGKIEPMGDQSNNSESRDKAINKGNEDEPKCYTPAGAPSGVWLLNRKLGGSNDAIGDDNEDMCNADGQEEEEDVLKQRRQDRGGERLGHYKKSS
ncbi:hypothetical protein EDB87DRAFT_1581687 [Lactarius vividus]|nr:hypothetical protein EDB87DRAFT_1581687 [Lactarius vividus]